MFTTLSFITDHNGVTADYHASGVYNTFVFLDGQCYEWSEDHAAIMQIIAAVKEGN